MKTMSPILERTFPRGGGKKPAISKASKSSLFKSAKKKTVKKSKKSDANGEILQKPFKLTDDLEVRQVDDLRPDIVHDGMIILGIVNKITRKDVFFELPGGLHGVVNLANISEFYSSLIEDSSEDIQVSGLGKMFEIGQIFPTKVISRLPSSNKGFSLSLDPKAINTKLSYDLLEEGFILVGNVKSEEDHGFIIDFGIANSHGFLRHDKIPEDRKLVIGQIIRCAVVECNVSYGACNMQLSVLNGDLKTAAIKNTSKLPVHCFIPGLQFQITVERGIQHGLKVTYRKGESFRGFIHENYVANLFSELSDFEPKSECIASLLYVKPLVNFPFFMMKPKKGFKMNYQDGEIVSAKVVKTTLKGVTCKIGSKPKISKCFVPLVRLPESKKLLENKEEIYELYPKDKVLDQVRLGRFHFFGRFYFGAADKATLEDKYFSINDLSVGQVVPCRITNIGAKITHLQIGKSLIGIVNNTDMTDVPLKNVHVKFKVGQKVKAKVTKIDLNGRVIYLTMKPSLVKMAETELTSYDEAVKGECYLGTVTRVFHHTVIVTFFNGVCGAIPKKLTPYHNDNSLSAHFSKGQLVKCYVHGKDRPNSLTLSLSPDEAEVKSEVKSEGLLKVGKKYTVTIKNKSAKYLFVKAVCKKDNKKYKGIMPAHLLSIHPDLIEGYLSTYSVGETMKAYCVHIPNDDSLPVFAPHYVFEKFYKKQPRKTLQNLLKTNEILPFLVKKKSLVNKTLYLSPTIPLKEGIAAKACKRKISFFETTRLHRHQFLYGKILNVTKRNVEVDISLNGVWDFDFESTLTFLNSYLNEAKFLTERQKKKDNNFLKGINFGSEVEGSVTEIKEKGAIIKLKNKNDAFAVGDFTLNQTVKGKIVWIDAQKKLVYLNVKPDCMSDISNDQSAELPPEVETCRTRIVYINETFVVGALKSHGNGKLIYLPRKRHVNDFNVPECLYKIGDVIQVMINRLDHLLGLDRQLIYLMKKLNANNVISLPFKKGNKSIFENDDSSKNPKKRKNGLNDTNKKTKKKRINSSEAEDGIEVVDVILGDDSFEIKQEVEDENEDDRAYENIDFNDSTNEDEVEIKSEEESDADLDFSFLDEKNREKIDLSSDSEDDEDEGSEGGKEAGAFNIGFNWDVLNNRELLSGTVSGLAGHNEDSTDDEDDAEESKKKNKKKRMTENEKLEEEKKKEQRLREIEEGLMDPNREPETADDFDRAVLSHPDSSALWLKYMAFHLQATEIEKARAVGKRALKSIPFNEEQEKLNIWTALLNMENLYGNEESFNKTVSEALVLNDPYKINLHVLSIHAQSNKIQEMEKLGNFMLKKFKDNDNVWHQVGSVYFSVGKVESARNVLQKSLLSLDKKKHIGVITKFAHLENKYGCSQRAQTLYESVLSSFPKRVDVWCSYVDMLVKSSHIETARQVLERATSQSLPPKKMKTLFKKFLSFEENHGSPENIEKVRQAAVEYVQSVGNSTGDSK